MICLKKYANTWLSLRENVDAMIEARKICNNITDIREKAIAYNVDVKDKYFDIIRYSVDKLELFVADDEWTLPKYREMLFFKVKQYFNCLTLLKRQGFFMFLLVNLHG